MARNDHFRASGRLFCRPGGHFLLKTGVFRLGRAIPRQMVSIPDGAGWIPNAAVWIPDGWVWLPRAAVWIPDEMVGLPSAAVSIPPRWGWHPERRGMATLCAGMDPAAYGRATGRGGIDPAAKGNRLPSRAAAGRARFLHRAARRSGGAVLNWPTPHPGALGTARPTSLPRSGGAGAGDSAGPELERMAAQELNVRRFVLLSRRTSPEAMRNGHVPRLLCGRD